MHKKNMIVRSSTLLGVMTAVLLQSCQPVPLTGRRQLNLIPDSQLLPASFQSYDQLLKEKEVVTATPEAAMLRRVGSRVQGAVEQYLRQKGLEDRLKGFEWEYNLIADSSVNAFAMPGGKVGVFTGIMPIASTEEGLATIVAHEIAHTIAEHGNERMSQLLLLQLGGVALQEALDTQPEVAQQLLFAAYGLGAQVGILLPYSRLHEREADHLGLIFMAMAGYNPREAVELWQRMAEAGGDPGVPSFLRTHPDEHDRIEHLRTVMPQALKYYEE
jgi:predicted Zn-dependent protease